MKRVATAMTVVIYQLSPTEVISALRKWVEDHQTDEGVQGHVGLNSKVEVFVDRSAEVRTEYHSNDAVAVNDIPREKVTS